MKYKNSIYNIDTSIYINRCVYIIVLKQLEERYDRQERAEKRALKNLEKGVQFYEEPV